MYFGLPSGYQDGDGVKVSPKKLVSKHNFRSVMTFKKIRMALFKQLSCTLN